MPQPKPMCKWHSSNWSCDHCDPKKILINQTCYLSFVWKGWGGEKHCSNSAGIVSFPKIWSRPTRYRYLWAQCSHNFRNGWVVGSPKRIGLVAGVPRRSSGDVDWLSDQQPEWRSNLERPSQKWFNKTVSPISKLGWVGLPYHRQ